MNKQIVGANIKYLRKMKNLSQGDLAGSVGLKRCNIASYESGLAEPKLENLLRIAAFFNVNLKELVSIHIGEDTENQHTIEEEQLPVPSLAPSSDALKTKTLDDYLAQAMYFRRLLDSLHCLHQYKMNELHIEKLPREWQLIAMHTHELFQLSEEIVRAHTELLTDLTHKNFR